MHYDPIKQTLGKTIGHNLFLRKLFYRILDLLLLRAWYVRKEIFRWEENQKGSINVLDAGSGFGQYTYLLARNFKKWKILGVDIKQEQVDDCNAFITKAKLGNARFEWADLTRFNHPTVFDLVISVDVMEHIETDIEVFRNLYQAMSDGGMLLVSTPSDQGGSDVHDNQSTSFIEEHVRNGYNITEIQNKLKAAGFKKTIARYQYGWPGKLSWRFSMKYPLKLLGVSKVFFFVLPLYYLILLPICLVLNTLDINISHKSGTGLIVKAFR